MPRPILLAAILASVLAHGVGLAVLVVLGQTATPTLDPAAETPPIIEVSILADPRAGAPSDTEDMTAEPPTPPAEAQAEQTAPQAQAEQTTPPAQAAQTAPLTEQPVDAAAETAAPKQPSALTDAPLPPAPPPPTPPSPPAPPRAATAPPSPAQARPQAGATLDGRDAGTTDIILGAHTAPPGVDPTALNTPPRYPPEAVRRGQQGIVQLRVLVATDGSAVTVEVAQSSGSALLDRAAREAVAKWRFRPGQQTGITIPTMLPISLSFTLIDTK